MKNKVTPATKIRSIRKRINAIRDVCRSPSPIDFENSEFSNMDFGDNRKLYQSYYRRDIYKNQLETTLSEAKMELGNCLKEVDNTGNPYKSKEVQRKNNNTDEIEEEVDTDNLNLEVDSDVEALDFLRDETQSLVDKLKRLQVQNISNIYGHWFHNHLENSAHKLITSKNYMGLILGEIKTMRKWS